MTLYGQGVIWSYAENISKRAAKGFQLYVFNNVMVIQISVEK